MKKVEKRIKRFGIISAFIGLIVGIIIILKFNNWLEAFFIGISIPLITVIVLQKTKKNDSKDAKDYSLKKSEKVIKRIWTISAFIGLIVGIIIILKFNNWLEAFFGGITISLITGFILERMIKVNSNDT